MVSAFGTEIYYTQSKYFYGTKSAEVLAEKN